MSKINPQIAQCTLTIFFGVIMVVSSFVKPSLAFSLVMIICGTISMTGLCIVIAIENIKNE